MLVRNSLFVLIVSCGNLNGDDAATYATSKSFAESIQSSLSISDSNQHIADVKESLDFKGDDVPETQHRSSDLSEAATKATYDSKNQAGSSLLDTQKNSLENNIRKDEIETLIEDGNAIVSDPMKIIGGTVNSKSKISEIVETTHICEESAEAIEHVCFRERVLHPKQESKKNDNTYYVHMSWTNHTGTIGGHYVKYAFPKDHLTLLEVPNGSFPDSKNFYQFKKIEIDISLKKHVRLIDKTPFHGDWHGYKDITTEAFFDSTRLGRYYLFTWGAFSALSGGSKDLFLRVSFDPEGNFPDFLIQDRIVLEDVPEEDTIDDRCQSLEVMTDKGLCRYGSARTIEGPGYRDIKFEGKIIRVYRDWWKKEFTYICKSPSKNNCEPFRKQGCDRVNSVCIERKGDLCVNYRKTYVCKSKTKGFEVTGFEGNIPFCLDGNCDDHSWTDNKDFADAMSKMALFKEMQDDMDAEKLTVFKGTEHQCNKDVMGFQDCCQGGGWGGGIGLAKTCSANEVELRELKAEKKCVYVGTYCAEKFLGICLRKKQSYCCFGSKLSKIVHEQGRQQLGIDWGSARHPHCRPFTVDEVKAIDFSQMDLSALFDGLINSTNMDNLASSSKQMTTRWRDKVKSAKIIKNKNSTSATKEYFGLDGGNASL